MTLRSFRELFSLLLLSFLAIPAFAQSTGMFHGQIKDPQGNAIVGAGIQVMNQETKVTQDAVSDETGTYSVPYLPAGKYKITVTSELFSTFVANDVELGVSQTAEYNVPMAVGSAGSTTVTVEGGGTGPVNTTTAEVTNTITGEEVKELPLNGRNFTQFLTSTPGVSNQSQQDEALVGPVGQAKYSFNGGRTEYNSFEVDGSDVLNLSIYPTAAPLIVTPSLDAIQEIKVLTSNYGAQYGRTASGIVQVVTKSGTSNFHGNAYEFLRNENFNARNYFDPPGSAPLYRRNDFGFTIGGPLYIPKVYNTKKDKTVFFFSEEFRFDQTPVPYRVGAPTAAELQGDFSALCAPDPSLYDSKTYPNCPNAGQWGPETVGSTPLTAQQSYIHNSVDANMLAIASTGLIPAANSTTGCSSSDGQCYVAAISPQTKWREELFHIDHDFSPKHRLILRFVHDAWDTTVLSPQWGYLGTKNTYPTVRNRFVGPGINAAVNLASTLPRNIFNILSMSYTDSKITLTTLGGPGVNLSRPAQLDSATCDPFYTTESGSAGCQLGRVFDNGFGGKIPGIVFTSTGSDFGGGNLVMDTGYTPWEHTSPTYNITDNATHTIGKHTIQAGSQFLLLQRNQTNSAVGAATGDVQGLITFHTGNKRNTFGSFLEASQPTSYQQDSAQGRFHQVAFIAEPYVQDDWKVSPRLTVNLGFRMSLFGNFHEQHKVLYNWEASAFNQALTHDFYIDPNFGGLILNSTGLNIPRTSSGLEPHLTNGLVRCGANGVPDGCQSSHIFNPAPRVGFAWDISGKGTSAIRGGYGLFFEHGTPYESNSGSLEANPPSILSVEQYNVPGGLPCIGGLNTGLANAGTPCPSSQSGAFPLSITSIPTKTKWAYAQQWNLSFQQTLPKDFDVTISYVGSRATHLTAERQLNQLQPYPAQLNPYGPHQPFLTGDCSANSVNGFTILSNNLNAACLGGQVNSPAAFRLTAPGIDKIASLESVADSSYHGFQFLGRRTKGPLTLDIAYTYSHSIDDSSDRSDIPVDGLDIHANKASSSFDQRNLFELNYVYALPTERWWNAILEWFPKDASNGWADSRTPVKPGRIAHIILEKWELSGLTLYQTGIPFSVYNAGYHGISTADNAGVANGLSPLFASYPDLVGGAKHNLQTAKELGGDNAKSFGPLLLNPAAFAAPRGLTFGSAGRNVLNNPHRTNFDASLLKHFTLPGEKHDLEFRAEGFNIFNHTQFRIYDPSQGNTPSNTISCYADQDANYSGGGGAGTDCYTGYAFLHPFNAHRARTIQFGLKLAF